ncbi:MAG: hypothetical protein ACYC64_11735 [Armatimonadota bacterium]
MQRGHQARSRKRHVHAANGHRARCSRWGSLHRGWSRRRHILCQQHRCGDSYQATQSEKQHRLLHIGSLLIY